jgi:hypothetical protein
VHLFGNASFWSPVVAKFTVMEQHLKKCQASKIRDISITASQMTAKKMTASQLTANGITAKKMTTTKIAVREVTAKVMTAE